MSKQAVKEMFENGVHIGHRTQKWNPRMKKFLYGDRQGFHIINLEKTEEYFERALSFLSKMKSEGKNVLFVSTKPQSIAMLEETANEVGMPFVTRRWIPGLLTNFATIKNRIKYLSDLRNQEAGGEFDKYTKKEATSLRKTIAKLDAALGGVSAVKDVPDAVFVLDPVRDAIVVSEANKLGLPVVAFTDSNADPSLIDYPVPANDDSLKSLRYLLGRVKDALKKPSKSKV